MVSDGLVEVVMDHVGSEITIDAVVTTENNRCKVMIRDAHTNIVKIEKDGIVIFETEDKMYREESRKKQARDCVYRKSVYDESGIIKRRTGFGQGSVRKETLS